MFFAHLKMTACAKNLVVILFLFSELVKGISLETEMNKLQNKI